MAEHHIDRQDIVACGAALFNLRLAARHLGLEVEVAVRPDPAEPALLASLRSSGTREPDQEEDELLAAVPRRHTRREPFERACLPPILLDRFVAAAAAEGASLLPIPPGPRHGLLKDMLSAAQPVAAEDAATVAGLRAPWAGAETGTGSFQVLTTTRDNAESWLCAGQALQRLLLTATTVQVSARFFTLLLEQTRLRERLRRELCDGAFPQVVLELGDVWVGR
jgi:hypothetical protein